MSNWFENIRDIRIDRRRFLGKTASIAGSATLTGAAGILGLSIGEVSELSQEEMIKMLMAKTMPDPTPSPDGLGFNLPETYELYSESGISVAQYTDRFNQMFKDGITAFLKEEGKAVPNNIKFGDLEFINSNGVKIKLESGITSKSPKYLLKGEKQEVSDIPTREYRNVSIRNMPLTPPSYNYFEYVGTQAFYQVMHGYAPRVHTTRITISNRGAWSDEAETHELSNMDLWNLAYSLRTDLNEALNREVGGGNPQKV